MKSIRRLTQSTLLLALLTPALASAGFLTQKLINNLPEQTQDAYYSRLPGYIAEAQQREGANPGEHYPARSLMIAPVVFNWAPEASNTGFPPLWQQGGNTAGVQLLANEIHTRIVDTIRTRGWAFSTPAWLREQGANLDAVGSKPASVNSRSYGGSSIGGYAYVSEKLKQWTPGDYRALKMRYPSIESAALVRINSTWFYEGHTRLNGEALVNYKVASTVEVTLCNGDGPCTVASINPGNPLIAILTVPAEKAADENRRADNNGFSIHLAADYYSGVVMAFLDNILTADYSSLAVEPAKQSVGSVLAAPASLKVGQSIKSPNQRFELTMQGNGNLVLTRVADRKLLWMSGSAGQGATQATMQQDSNFVLYKADGTPVWASDTWQKGAVRATLQDDGNLVLYKADGTPVWASNTCCRY